MDRRRFLTRAGLLLGSVGVAESFRIDLMDRISSSLLPKAEADELAPRRQLEICFRSGIPMMIFGSGQEFNSLAASAYSNFSYAGSDVIRASSVSNLYMNTDSQALMPHASNIAITQGVMSQGGHTNLFNFREGGSGQGKTTPIVELANANPTGSLIHGVRWPGDARNSVNGERDLIALGATGDFQNLFRNPRLLFEGRELASILDTAQKLSRRQAIMLESKLKNSVGQSESHRKATQMFKADYSQMLSTSGMSSVFASGSYMGVREAIARSLKGFEHNLINSSMVTVALGDWHGYQTDKQNASIIRAMSQIIAAAVDFLKATPDPAAPGSRLWDTTLIVAGSEFTRGISKFAVDNSDGATQGVMLIGKNVRGNYYGGFTLPSGATQMYGTAHGFDPQTGATRVGTKNSTQALYYTVKAASGLKLSTTERDQTFSCMLAG